MMGRVYMWWPMLELEKGETYRLHLSSIDLQHGFSLQPVNINLQVHPGYEMVVTMTPNQAGPVRHRLQRVLRLRASHDDRPHLRRRQQKTEGPVMSAASIFRTCPTTGLKVDRSAENLIKANAVVAVVFLLDRRPVRAVGRADALAGRAPAPGRLVLPRADRARLRRAAVLDHLLRDGGAVFRLRDTAQFAARRATLGAGRSSA